MYYRWLRLSQFLFCMTGCCFSLIEQDVSVLFCQAVSVVGRGSSPNSAVDVLSLFPHFFCFGFDGMGENYIFCRLVSPLLLWCLFPLLCCLFWTSCGVVFCLQMCASCRKAGSLRGWAFFFLGLCYPVFSFFLYENILYLHFFFPLVYLFFLFFSLLFLSSCFVNMLGWLLSFFQIFFLFALFHLYLLLLFFLNSISLYKHWFLNFICFLTIVYKDVKKYLFLYV